MQMYKQKTLWTLVVLALLLPLTAWATPVITVAIKAEKEVVVTENGQKITKIVEAQEIFPGEIVIYTLTYRNTGSSAAQNVAITDPLPEGTSYLPGSASEVGDLVFSIDQGQTYKRPSLLTYMVTQPDGSVVTRVASPEEYTHIRWTIPEILPGAEGAVSFKARIK